MDRRSFMKLFGMGGAAAAAVPAVLAKAVNKVEAPLEVPELKSAPRSCGGWPAEPYAVDEQVVATPKEDFYNEKLGVPYEPPARSPAIVRGGRTRGDLRGCTITFKDGNDQSLTIQIGEGSLTWTEHQDYVFELDRGRLDTVRQADEQPVDVALDMCFDWINVPGQYAENPLDFFRQPFDENGLTMLVEMDDEWYEFRGFFWEQMDYDMSAAALSLSGRCMDV